MSDTKTGCRDRFFEVYKSKKEAWLIGFTVGAFVIALVWLYFFLGYPHCSSMPLISDATGVIKCNIYPKDISMEEKVTLITKNWEDCWLAIDEKNNDVGYKCRGFFSPIGYKAYKTKPSVNYVSVDMTPEKPLHSWIYFRDCVSETYPDGGVSVWCKGQPEGGRVVEYYDSNPKPIEKCYNKVLVPDQKYYHWECQDD